MKNKTISSQDLVNRFRRWQKTRNAAQFGAIALVSISNLRNSQAYAESDTNHQVRQLVMERATDDSILDEEIAGVVSRFADRDEVSAQGKFMTGQSYTLSAREKSQLAGEYARPVKVTVVTPDSELLPADFVPVPVSDFESIIIHDSEIEAQAEREAAIEIAWLETCMIAVMFDSEPFTGIPVDYSPDAGRKPVRTVSVTAPVVSKDEKLRLAVLALSR